MNNKFIYNPFISIAGIKSILFGFSGLLLTSFLAYITGTHYYGHLNIEFAKDSPFWIYLVENSISWIVLSILLFISGLILSKSRIRVIDIFGTILFSRIPLLLLPLIRLIPALQSFVSQSPEMYFLIVIFWISMIWTVILSFNAYKVSCNLINEKLVISFIVCIILAEVITKTIIYLLI